MLKKGWQERELVTGECHDRKGKPGKRSVKKLARGSSQRRSYHARHLGCVIQDMKPPKSILPKSLDMQKAIQRVKFTKAIARHTQIRDQNLSVGFICSGEHHQRISNTPKFEDRSQEETEWQEQGAREAAWKLAKNVFKIKEHERATFFSPSENRCLPASTLKPEDREFVVDSGAWMHMISKKDLGDAEMNTLAKSCSPAIVITASGEVQTHKEATVSKISIFSWLRKSSTTPVVLSLGKLSDDNGYSFEWINGQQPHLTQRRDSDNLQYGKLGSYRGSRLVKFFLWIFINFTDIFETGESFFFIFFILIFFTYSRRNSVSGKRRCD